MSPESLQLRFELAWPDFSLALDERVPLAGVTAVFGPSGSGKSTLLRAIAGFVRPDGGRIACGGDARRSAQSSRSGAGGSPEPSCGEIWFDAERGVHVPPYRRPVGFMFQDARLFAHLTVAGNLAYAERRRRRHLPGVDRSSVVDALDLEPLLARRVTSLSGGERRRVALGRTLLSAPRLLLLDEPLTGLDLARKAEILPYLERVPERFGIPTLYVSHDIDEVARLADRMLVLTAGRVQVHDTTAVAMEQLDLQPDTGRYEAGVLLSGRVLGHDARLHLTRVDVAGQVLTLPLVERLPAGAEVRVRVRSRDVALAVQEPVGLSIRNIVPGTVGELLAGERGTADVRVDFPGGHLRARITVAAVEQLALRPGSPVYALVKSVSFDGMI